MRKVTPYSEKILHKCQQFLLIPSYRAQHESHKTLILVSSWRPYLCLKRFLSVFVLPISYTKYLIMFSFNRQKVTPSVRYNLSVDGYVCGWKVCRLPTRHLVPVYTSLAWLPTRADLSTRVNPSTNKLLVAFTRQPGQLKSKSEL